MEALFRFLAAYELPIYLVLGLGLIIVFRWLWQALRELRDAIFGLEKQIAMRHFSTTIAIIVVILMLAMGELYITSFLVPDLPASTFLSTPTVDVLSTQLPVSQSNLSSGTLISQTGTADAPDAASTPEGCSPGQITISSPTPGENVKGIVELYGTVDVQDMGFYKFEFTQAGLDSWATFFAGRLTEENKPIGVWDTSQLVSGDYQVRLVVTDNQGNEFTPCVITYRVTGGE